MTQTMIEYIKTCPLIAQKNVQTVYTPSTPYSISLTPAGEKQVLSRYTDGDTMEEQAFTLRIRLPFIGDAKTDTKELAFAEGICLWLREQNAKNQLPEPEGLTCVSVSGAVKDIISKSTNTFCAEITVRVVYYAAMPQGK